MIDTHAHIYLPDFKDDLEEVINRSKSMGIAKIYMPNIDSSSIEDMLELETKYPGYCIPMMGLHPGSVDRNFQKELYIIEDWLGKKKFAAVGEIGMDLYWDKSYKEEQKEAFQYQIELAKKHALPVVIHNRDAFTEVYGIVNKNITDNLTGIFHCFSGSHDEAKKIISLGFYIGIGGVVTYKKSGLDLVVPDIDMGKIVLETDSPYLTPVPFRGKRNQPEYLGYIIAKIAELKNIPPDNIVEATSDNAKVIFSI